MVSLLLGLNNNMAQDMQTFEVEGKDGRVFEVDAPKGTSFEKILGTVKKSITDYWDVQTPFNKLEEAQVKQPVQPQVAVEQPKTIITNSDIFDLDKIKFIESGGNGYNEDGSYIKNSSGAVGPYQIIPSMAKDPGYGIKGIDVMNTTEEEHRAYANDYLSKSLDYFKKSFPNKTNQIDMSIASYNYGISAVEKLVKKHGNLRWKEHLPKETAGYLKKYYND